MRKLRILGEVVAVALLVTATAASPRAVADHDDDGRMSRRQWVTAVMRETNGVTRAEARAIWRHPGLRSAMPVTTHINWHGSPWTPPALGASPGCHVSSTEWVYGYGITMAGTIPVFSRDPLFRYTLHRTWLHDGSNVAPQDEWDTEFLTSFADLRWNFDGAFDVENFFAPVGTRRTHTHSRKGRFSSITALGGALHTVPRRIVAKADGGWETSGHTADFCTDND